MLYETILKRWGELKLQVQSFICELTLLLQDSLCMMKPPQVRRSTGKHTVWLRWLMGKSGDGRRRSISVALCQSAHTKDNFGEARRAPRAYGIQTEKAPPLSVI